MRTDMLAIVFTDIKGYTEATSQQTHAENAKMLLQTERLIRPIVICFGGRIIKSIGDAYMIAFRSPTVACQCAAAIQDKLYQYNHQSDTTAQLHVRIAVNIGEVRVERGDIFGDPVNAAARIESITPADQIYFSKAVYLTMNRSLLPIALVGDFDLKGLAEPITIYQLKPHAHLDEDQAANVGMGGYTPQGEDKALPFGNQYLQQAHNMQWRTKAYQLMYALVTIAMLIGTYFRYRPGEHYDVTLEQAKVALQEKRPLDALMTIASIPATALEERTIGQRYRKQAVESLIQMGQLEPAEQELKNMLKEERRDGEIWFLRALLASRKSNEVKIMLESFQQAFRFSSGLADTPGTAELITQAYLQPNYRKQADKLVEDLLGARAIPHLQRLFADPTTEHRARRVIANRLEKLGVSESIDWVTLAIDDLKSTSCGMKRTAITKLAGEADDRAIGPLMKLTETKACGAKEAKLALDQIMGK